MRTKRVRLQDALVLGDPKVNIFLSQFIMGMIQVLMLDVVMAKVMVMVVVGMAPARMCLLDFNSHPVL